MLDNEHVDACAQYILDMVKHIIVIFGTRSPGSEGERKTQEFIRDELGACCDGEVRLEPFTVAPKAFMGFQRTVALLLFAALPCYWLMPWAAAALSILAMLVFVFEFLLYKEFLDPFFYKDISYNVMGMRKAKGETKRRIIVSGHADAAFEFRFNHLCSKKMIFVSAAMILAMMFNALSCIAFAFSGGDWDGGYQGVWFIIGIMQLAFLPGLLGGFFFNNFGVVAPGANDNLTGALLGVGIAKQLAAADLRLENTDLVILSAGSEEAGLRGAKNYAAKHIAELREVETIFIGVDTLRDLEHMKVYHRDMNGLVKHDPRVCKLLKDAGAACGLDLPYATVFAGSSDTTAFTQAGIPSAAFCAMDPAPAAYYHTRLDNWDNMDKQCLRKGIEVVMKAIETYDKNGLE